MLLTVPLGVYPHTKQDVIHVKANIARNKHKKTLPQEAEALCSRGDVAVSRGVVVIPVSLQSGGGAILLSPSY